MFPIFEQGGGKGIGHGFDSFLDRFDAICAEHVATGRARAFAFILYDFTDRAFKQIMKDQGVFAQLDRLSGRELSVFYLHAGTREAMGAFNAHFIRALGIADTPRLPCVVFFRIDKRKIKNVQVAQLENSDLVHGFKELYEVIGAFIAAAPHGTRRLDTTLKWLKSSSRFISVEAIRVVFKMGLEHLFARP